MNSLETNLKPPPHANAEAHRVAMSQFDRKTPAQRIAVLVKAGICTPDGELTEQYRDNGPFDEK